MVDETSSGNDSNTGTTSSSTGTNKHSGGPYGDSLIRIQKSALAFRYRPPSWSSLDDAPLTSVPSGYAHKRSYELTLEYGPSRRGSALDQESMPVVVGGLGGGAFGGSGVRYPGDGYAHVAQANGDDSDGSNNNGQQGETLYPDERYVTWDNEAKIYYRTEIDEEEWVEAYYVAPISGAVLSKVLDYAVEYAERHRRYQPFEVVGIGGDGEADKEDDSDDGNDGADSNSYGNNCDFGSSCETKRTGPSLDHPKTILRSSSADDFVWSVFDKLASMYVDIRPILAPPRERVRFFVRGVQDVQKLSGIVSAEDLALPGVPIDDDDDSNDDEDNNDTTLGDSAGSGVKGGGRDDEEDEYPSNESGVSGPGRNVASLAADFYTRFYDCANAIRTGDYGKWERTVTPRPTMEPTASPDTVTTDSPTAAENGEDSGADENEEPILHNPAEGAEKEEGDEDGTDDDDNDDIVNDNDGNDDGVDIDDIDAEDPPNRRLKQMKKAKNDQANSTIAAEEPSLTAKAATPETEPVPEPGLTEFESQEVLAAAKEDTIDDGDDNDATDGAYTAGQDDDGQDEEQPQEQIDEASAAEQAAKEALDKANDAAAAISSNTDDEAVAAAAQEAANAAKKAAEASSLAKAAAGMDAIFSADGGQMTQILATCLNDPKDEIRVDRKVALPSPSPVDDREMEDGSSPDAPEHRYATVSTTHVFLYIDGTSYYRLNLTPPFWDASPAIQNMPQPKLYEEGQAQILDSLFFFGIIGAFVFGMVVLLHNIGVLRIDPRLKFKSFFHPPHPGPAGGTRGGYMNATQVRESGGYRDEVDVDSDSCFTDEASDAADWKNGSDEPRPTRGGGQVHPFNNPSAIPTIFMGKSSSTQNLQVGAAAATAAADSWEGDFELSDMKGTDSRQGSESCRSSSNRSGADLDFGQSGAMGSRIDNMKAAMDDDDNDENDDSAGKTPKGRGRSRSFRRDDPNRSVHSASSSSNRRRRSPVDSVPLPAQVRASRDPEFVDLPGLKSLTPVAIPQGISRQSSRASASKSKRSLSGELQQESVVDDGHENSDFGGSSNGSTPLAIV